MKKNVLFCLVFLASFALAIHADDAPTVYTIDQIKTKIANKEKVKGLLVKGVIGTYTLNNKRQYKNRGLYDMECGQNT